MNIMKKKIGQSELLFSLTKGLIIYLIFTVTPTRNNQNIINITNIPHKNITQIQHSQLSSLEEKIILDLSKYDVLHLVKDESTLHISLDREGKIIGYRPFIAKMPSYWNSEVTKKILVKNNLFSLSQIKEQAISFRLSSLN
jgi:hypothetical protein